MEHREAVELMATERYLLGELSPEMRDAFEEHYFDCQECAFDLRTAAAFVQGARAELPNLSASSPARTPGKPFEKQPKRRAWLAWWRPTVAIPAFAVLLAVVGYQNLATIPSLRSAATGPRLAPWTTLHAGTRGGAHMPVVANPRAGAVILIDVPNEAAYPSFAFELQDPQGKPFWTGTTQSQEPGNESGAISLLIPGSGLQPGSYTLTISGIAADGGRTQLDQRILDVSLNE